MPTPCPPPQQNVHHIQSPNGRVSLTLSIGADIVEKFIKHTHLVHCVVYENVPGSVKQISLTHSNRRIMEFWQAEVALLIYT